MPASHQLHENLSPDEAVEGGSDRSFGLVFSVFFGLIGGWKLIHDGPSAPWWLAAAAATLALALAYPKILGPFNRLWTKFGLLLHRVTNPIVMGVLFFGGVVPIGLLMRALGKRPLPLGFDPAADSYWVVRQPPGPTPDSIRRQF